MTEAEQDSQMVEAGPPSASLAVKKEEAQSTRHDDDAEPAKESPLQLFLGPSSPTEPSSSPSSSQRGTKRHSAVSPAPEEVPSSHPTTSTSQPAAGAESKSKRPRPTVAPTRGGNRLFSVLTSTLSQFKRDSESSQSATIAANRSSIQARLNSKLAQTSTLLSSTDQKRALAWEARSIAEEIATGDAQRKTLRGMKRRMASFLFTPPPAKGRKGDGRRLAEEIPTSEISRRGDDEGVVYFSPGKTLLEQEDWLNDQEDDVDEKIDKFDDSWDERRRELVERLEEVKEKIRKL